MTMRRIKKSVIESISLYNSLILLDEYHDLLEYSGQEASYFEYSNFNYLSDSTFIFNSQTNKIWFKITFSLLYLRLWYNNTIFDNKLKNMSKYITYIQDKRFVSGKEMFSNVQNKETASSLLYKYKKKNIITKIRKNVYLPTNLKDGFVDENKYEIGCSSVARSYLSYHSAMEYYGLQNQVFNRIYLSAPKRFRPFEFDYVEYIYAPDKFREGIVKDATRNIYYTELERTVVDCIDRIDLAGGIEELIYNIELIDKIDESKILFYLSLYEKQVIYQKAGFIFSRLKNKFNITDYFIEECKKKIGKSTRYLTDKYESQQVYLSEWKLCVPEYILLLTK